MRDLDQTETCFLCGSNYKMGPHLYDGKYIHAYEMSVCLKCWKGNWDGWASQYEQKIMKHLQERGLPIPERNEKGWFPRE